MKQNRRARSLLLSKQLGVSNILTVMLCILGGVLCWGAISLLFLNRPTLAAGDNEEEELKNIQYSAVDDKVEVLSRLSFTITGDDNKATIVSEMYQSGTTLYVVPKPLVVNYSPVLTNENILGSGVWGNILGGYDNKVYSDNITIVGGKGNFVNSGNMNSTVLGGVGNTLGAGNETPSIMVGGENNKVEDNKGVNLLIGGKGNTVSNTESVNIVGGENNKVEDGSNVIIGGSNVTVGSGVKNVFVFSDGSSITLNNPSDESDAFYLQVENGLGLNVKGTKKGVESNGAVSFGEININVKQCRVADLGLEGVWSGCLVGCTHASMSTGYRWEMLDQGEKCEKQCEGNNKCISLKDIEVEHPYTSFCSTGFISTINATRCTPISEMSRYKNVVFETALIDSESVCPNGENKCIYKCNAGYHLTGDTTGSGNATNKVACYKDCELPWDHTKKVKHNEMITGYNNALAYCSIDNFNFGADAWTTHDDCSKHKAKLVCNDGAWYVWRNNSIVSSAGAYTGETCTLMGHTCNISSTGYHLTQDVIDSSLHDPVPSANPGDWNRTSLQSKDGKRIKRTKGIYKLCIDYTAIDNPNGETCRDDDPYHFRLVKCMNGYMTGAHHPGECRKQISVIYDWQRNGGTSMNMNNEIKPVTSGYLVDLTTPKATKQIAGVGEWTFLGWNTDPDAHVGLTGEVRVPNDNDFRLYAIFTKEITATFRTNGDGIALKKKIGANLVTQSPTMTGSCVMWNKDTTCTFTGTYTFARTGWSIDGWSTNKNATSATYGTGNVPYTISKDTDLHTISHKPWKATFNKNGATKVGGSENPVVKPCNIYNKQTTCTVTTPSIERPCWTPKGWNTDQNATTGVAGTITLSSDMAYYAITLKTLKASFDANTGVAMNKLGLSSTSRTSQTCQIKNAGIPQCNVTLPAISTKNLYSAKGWTLYSGAWTNNVINPGAEYTLVDNGSVCSYDLKFYAQVTNDCGETYKVVFAYTGNGGSSISGTKIIDNLLPGSSVSLVGSSAPIAKRTGWSFSGWNLDKTKHVGQSNVVIDSCADKVVYPIFNRKCTVSFNTNGATSLSSTSSTCTLWNTDTSCTRTAPSINPSTNTPRYIGFSTGANVHVSVWSVNETKDVYLSSLKTIHCGGTYYAQTTKDPVSYKITFNPNGNNSFNYKGTTKTATSSFTLCQIPATWNGSGQATSCSGNVTFPTIVGANSTPNVIGWSTAANRHTADYKVNQTKTFTVTSDATYYAQTSGSLVLKVNFENNPDGNCTVSSPKQKQCTSPTVLYNGATTGQGCSIKSPSATAVNGYSIRGFNTNPSASAPTWGTGVTKTVTGDIEHSSQTYYCISERLYTDCIAPDGTAYGHNEKYESFTGSSKTCGTCQKIISTCNGVTGRWDKEPTNIKECTEYNCCKDPNGVDVYPQGKFESYEEASPCTPCNKITSTCQNNGEWDKEPTNIKTCKQKTKGCGDSCSPCWGKEAKDGDTCIVYNDSECYGYELFCRDGTWYDDEEDGYPESPDADGWYQNQPESCPVCGKCQQRSIYGCEEGISLPLADQGGVKRWQCIGNAYCATTSTVDCEYRPTIPPCFPAGTQVIMADGTKKNIENIEEGDIVLSYNTDTNKNEGNIVKKKLIHEDSKHEMYNLTIDGEILKVTDAHRFYVRKSKSSNVYDWVAAKNLKVGDILLKDDGSLVKIDEISHYPNQETVYNFEVENNHNYYVAEGYLVHNQKGCYEDCDPCDAVKGLCNNPCNPVCDPCIENPSLPECQCDERNSSNCHYSCFPEGTQVVMADGTKKNIEKVEKGDMVVSYNTDTNTNESSAVVQTIVHEDNEHEMYELTIDGHIVKVTGIHPFYVRKPGTIDGYKVFGLKAIHAFEAKHLISSQNYDWVQAKNLKVGDRLLMIDGSLSEVEAISHYSNQETVYNLEVDGNHDYFVDWGYLVHNKGGGGGGGGGGSGDPTIMCSTWKVAQEGSWDPDPYSDDDEEDEDNPGDVWWKVLMEELNADSDYCMGGFSCVYDPDLKVCKDSGSLGSPNGLNQGDRCCCVPGQSSETAPWITCT